MTRTIHRLHLSTNTLAGLTSAVSSRFGDATGITCIVTNCKIVGGHRGVILRGKMGNKSHICISGYCGESLLSMLSARSISFFALPKGVDVLQMQQAWFGLEAACFIQDGFFSSENFHQEVIHDHDVTGKAAEAEASHIGHLTEEEKAVEKKLRRKIDSLIMPLVILVYLMNYIDRNNYAAAKLQGLKSDLSIDEQQYQVGLSILFVGYVLMQVPSNLLLNFSGRPSWYLGFFVTAWGLVSLLTSQVNDYGDIVACRFILGVVEAPFFAGVLFYLSKWYTKAELNLRMSIFYSGSLLSGAFGNLIAAGILNGLDGDRGLSAWQWLYIIEGSITMFIGIVIVFVLPDFPHTWKLLSAEMKHVATRRMALDAAEADIDEAGGMSQIKGMKAAFSDPKTWLLAIMYHGTTGAAGFQNFFPSLTEELYPDDKVNALLVVAPPYLFMVMWSLTHGIVSDKLRNRFWFFVYPVPLVMIGAFIFMFTDNFGARYFSMFLLVFIFSTNGTIYAWIANAIPRPPAKRAVALAFVNSVGNAASIWTPFTYSPGPDGHYKVAMGINIGLVGMAGIGAIILRIILEKENKQLARLEDEDATLTEKDIRKLNKTAEMEGLSFAAARQLQKGYRYMQALPSNSSSLDVARVSSILRFPASQLQTGLNLDKPQPKTSQTVKESTAIAKWTTRTMSRSMAAFPAPHMPRTTAKSIAVSSPLATGYIIIRQGCIDRSAACFTLVSSRAPSLGLVYESNLFSEQRLWQLPRYDMII
ncbi:permease of the major facilitator superfamily [Hortaea werneckii]|nr:permease of the major facilitator superfamily [Hortaea werneckii]